MKIAINGMYLIGEPTGIPNLIISSIVELAKINQIIIFSPLKLHSMVEERFKDLSNIQVIVKPFPKFNVGTLWFFLVLPRLVNKYGCDLFWNPAMWVPFFLKRKLKTLVTINDFVSRDFKNTMKLANRIVSSVIENHSIKRADYLWCISEYTKSKLLQFHPEVKQPVFIGCAVDDFFERIDKTEYENSVTREKPFLLFVGSVEPRKNLSFLLEIFRELHKKVDYQLVIVGAKGWGNTGIADIINSEGYPKEDVIFSGYINNLELRTLYNTATCFVSTSLNEGFGMPQVEAMKCGCPVVTAHNSAMIEVVSGAGTTVEGWRIEDWCNAIVNTINSSTDIIERQNERCKRFNWNYVCKNLTEFILDN